MSELEFWLSMLVLASPFILFIAYRIYCAHAVLRRIREVYPDADMDMDGVRFTHKGFKALLEWDHGGKYRRGSTTLRLKIPSHLIGELSAAIFRMDIAEKGHSSHLALPEEIQRRCRIGRNAPAMMQALVRDKDFLAAVDGLRLGYGLEASLGQRYFRMLLPGTALTDDAEDMAAFVINTAAIFDRVIAAAAAINPRILSMPPISENYSIKPDEFIKICSDESLYDSLDDSFEDSPKNAAGDIDDIFEENSPVNDAPAADDAVDNVDNHDNELDGLEPLQLESADSVESAPLAIQPREKLPPPPPRRINNDREKEREEDESMLFF